MNETLFPTHSHQTTRILAWNANGLLKRKTKLEMFLKTEQIDIALISETHLTSRLRADIYGYKLYTCHHPSGNSHGGTAIYIRSSLQHYEVQSYSKPTIQAAILSVRLHVGTDVRVGAIYSPPRHTVLRSEYDRLFAVMCPKWIAGGDFNAKHPLWGSRLTTTKGKNLYDSLMRNNVQCYSNGSPTYWPTDPDKRSDCIDFFLSHGISANYIDIQNMADLSSDHSPLILTISDTILRKQTASKITSKFKNWEQFREVIHNNLDLKIRLKTPEEIDAAMQYLQTVIVDAAKVSTPQESATLSPFLPKADIAVDPQT